MSLELFWVVIATAFSPQPVYPPAAAAAANYADPSDMSRYQASVSLAYYQGGGADPTLSAAGGRDQYSSGGADKFGRAEVGVSVSQASVGQASQGEHSLRHL